MAGSKQKLCNREFYLDWDAGTFTVLGVTFSPDINEIWNLNFPPKLEQIQCLLSHWKKRSLTTVGKICVIKSLAVSKLIPLFTALHNPPLEMLKQLERVFYKFIWNGPDKTKRNIINKQYKTGGLQMTNLTDFIHSLKVTWLRRIISGPKKWQQGFKCILEKFPFFWDTGLTYIKTRLLHVSNIFWKDVLKAWVVYIAKRATQNIAHILEEKLWYNDKCVNTTLFFPTWARKKITVLKDIIAENGQPLSIAEPKGIYGVNGTFLDYERLLHNISYSWLDLIKSSYKPSCDLYLDFSLEHLLKDKRGCKRVYLILHDETIVNPCEKKWETELSLTTINWRNVYMSHWNCTRDTKLIAFQHKILHKYLTTNIVLSKIGIKDSDLCSFCSLSKESVSHLFYNCPIVKTFWTSVEDWLSTSLSCRIVLDKQTVFLNNSDQHVINHIILMSKYYIYCSKFNNNPQLSLQNVINIFRKTCKIEKQIAYTANNVLTFFRKWYVLNDILIID